MLNSKQLSTTPESGLEVMVIEPLSHERNEFRALAAKNSAYKHCAASSTLDESAQKIRGGAKFDAFFVSSRIDLNLVSNFVRMNRDYLKPKAANLLVLATGSLPSRELKQVRADGYLLAPKVPEDLDASATFIKAFKQEQLNINRAIANSIQTEPNQADQLRALCARLAVAVDQGPEGLNTLRQLGDMLKNLKTDQLANYFDHLIDFFSEIKRIETKR